MTLIEGFELVNERLNIHNLWDLVAWMGAKHPEEDIYLNVIGELEMEEFEYLYPDFNSHTEIGELDKVLSEVVDMWYKCNGVNWWGWFRDPQGNICLHMDQ